MAFREYATERVPGVRLSSQTCGAAAELLVTADLMFRGWVVYRAVSPNAPWDLMACKGDKTLRIEVRSGTRSGTGRLAYSAPARPFDVLAIVDVQKMIEYRGPRAAALAP
jgi:hypothetical protein